jgi:Holliday junction resolvasome RuvABC endonuclease subunit
MRLLGLDPVRQHTGWGRIVAHAYRLRFLAEGFVSTSAHDALADRLLILNKGLAETFAFLPPDEAAV